MMFTKLATRQNRGRKSDTKTQTFLHNAIMSTYTECPISGCAYLRCWYIYNPMQDVSYKFFPQDASFLTYLTYLLHTYNLYFYEVARQPKPF